MRATTVPPATALVVAFAKPNDASAALTMIEAVEDELVSVSSDYDIVAADPLYFRAVRSAGKVPLPHRALSAQLYL